jgi:hypothetical protein
LLTRHTHIATVLVAAIAFPAAAASASAEGGGGSKVAVAPARPAALTALVGPVRSFRRTVRVTVTRIEAQRRAALRRERQELFATLPAGVSQATLDAIGACESGGDPTAVSSDGSYRGKYQFDYGTWESMGGSGDPAAAPEAEQDYRAALLYAQAGSSPWPVCG